MNDVTRAALMAVASSLLNVLVAVDIVHLDGSQLGQINVFIGNAVLLIALVWKTGEGKAPLPSKMTVGEDKVQTAVRKASEDKK